MRFSEEDSIVRFLKVYDSLVSRDQNRVPLEAIALKAGVNINQLVGAIVFCFRSVSSQRDALKAMAEHSGVLDQTIRNAKRPKGHLDRKVLHQAVGFLPTPQGQSFNFNFPGKDRSEESDSPDASPPEINDIFPAITDKQQHWQSERQKLLQNRN